MQIDHAFPGGNILLEKIEGDDVTLRQDLRDTEGWWFYWCFRVRGAAGRTLHFHFPDTGEAWQSVIGVRGPAVSRDEGRHWNWLGRGSASDFSFTFGADDDAVRFSFAMPYQEDRLERFLDCHVGHPRLRRERLCHSRKGRSVERLHLGCLHGAPRYRVALTCRHHACEMMASYSLEGLLEEILGDSEAGAWLGENVEFLAIPFVDKDGVEDGDQGKSRKPHDHALDYGEHRLYPETTALAAFLPEWSRGKLAIALDLHCPSIRGPFHEDLMSPDRLRDAGNWARTEDFFRVLEKVQQGPLIFRLADSQAFTTWTGPEGPKGPVAGLITTWVRTLPGLRFGTALEIPYANAGGKEVNQESATAFGRDLARALHRYLADG
ncbi:MAG: hypothetical protein J0L75_05980 [Spirochaetes bacterium]|nr:hypothetical protein [Spirochaetota bacterium]